MDLSEIFNYKTEMMAMVEARGDLKEAFAIANHLRTYFRIDQNGQNPYAIPLNLILNFINVWTSALLNDNQLANAEKACHIFDIYANSNPLMPNLLAIHFRLYAEAKERQGHLQISLNLLEQGLTIDCSREHHVKLLYQKGNLETELYGVFAGINALCEALREGEDMGDSTLINECYRSLSRMFATMGYPSVGLSLLNKAEVHYMEMKDDYHLMITHMYMAVNYFCIYVYKINGGRKDVDFNKFMVYARKYIDEIDGTKLTVPSDVAYYNRTYGLIYRQKEPLEKALSFYTNVKAWLQVCQCADYLRVICQNEGDLDGMRKYAEVYGNAALKIKDSNRLEAYKQIVKALDKGNDR